MPNDFSLETVQELYPEYNISEFIDSGGSKDVFRGELDGEDIVVKLLPIESRHRLRRAEREARAMEIIDSEIFVELVEHFIDELPDDDSTIFVIVEEYIEGESLREHIDQGDVGVDLGVKVLREILQVLEVFDENNIVHRDIKPSNIMITNGGSVKLLDVGIARFTKKTSLTATSADHAPGTRDYMAPEQIENKKHEQDIRTDLFSLGVVMYEAIKGEHPFDHKSDSIPDEVLKGHKKQLNGDIERPGLSDIFNRLTEYHQYDRYRKPEFALGELEIVLEDGDV